MTFPNLCCAPLISSADFSRSVHTLLLAWTIISSAFCLASARIWVSSDSDLPLVSLITLATNCSRSLSAFALASLIICLAFCSASVMILSNSSSRFFLAVSPASLMIRSASSWAFFFTSSISRCASLLVSAAISFAVFSANWRAPVTIFAPSSLASLIMRSASFCDFSFPSFFNLFSVLLTSCSAFCLASVMILSASLFACSFASETTRSASCWACAVIAADSSLASVMIWFDSWSARSLSLVLTCSKAWLIPCLYSWTIFSASSSSGSIVSGIFAILTQLLSRFILRSLMPEWLSLLKENLVRTVLILFINSSSASSMTTTFLAKFS